MRIIFAQIFLFSLYTFTALGEVPPISSSLAQCYARHAKQREKDGDKNAFLIFQKKSIDAMNNNLPPQDPFKAGVNIENGLSLILEKYNFLLSLYQNKSLIQKEYNMLAELQCLYDCWVLENRNTSSGFKNSIRCQKQFLHNIQVFNKNEGNVHTKKPIKLNKVKQDQSWACSTIYFTKNQSTPSLTDMSIIEKVIHDSGTFPSYIILITGYINPINEPHYGRLLTKKRMVFIKKILSSSKIPDCKITGEVNIEDLGEDIFQDLKYTGRVKICVMDALLHNPGSKFKKDEFS